MNMMHVSVNRDLCTGHGRCYMLAPDVFDADEAGYCTVKVSEVDGDLLEQARVGVNNCPEDAISIS